MNTHINIQVFTSTNKQEIVQHIQLPVDKLKKAMVKMGYAYGSVFQSPGKTPK